MPACPVCGDEMKSETRSGVTVDVCAKHGIWLDQKELFLITEAERHDKGAFVWADLFRGEVHPPTDDQRELRCPISGKPMKRDDYEGVQIDWSPGYGVWLDNGELEAILNNLRLDGGYVRGWRLRMGDLEY